MHIGHEMSFGSLYFQPETWVFLPGQGGSKLAKGTLKLCLMDEVKSANAAVTSSTIKSTPIHLKIYRNADHQVARVG